MNTSGTKNKEMACLVFVTHVLTDDILKYMAYLKKSINGIMDMLILYDTSHNPINVEDYPEYTFTLFDSKTLEGFFHMGERRLPNALIALIECHILHKYDKYLVMEYDIILNGNFSLFANRIIKEGENTDYIHIASDALGGPQEHWPIELIRNCHYRNLRFAWCQIFFISSRLLRTLQRCITQNKSIYYEFLIPTVAYEKSFVTRQFENFGYKFDISWGPVEEYENRYKYGRQMNTFYHPIKNLSLISFFDDNFVK